MNNDNVRSECHATKYGNKDSQKNDTNTRIVSKMNMTDNKKEPICIFPVEQEDGPNSGHITHFHMQNNHLQIRDHNSYQIDTKKNIGIIRHTQKGRRNRCAYKIWRRNKLFDS